MSTTVEITTEIRPFTVEVGDGALADLEHRIKQTRWPDEELVVDSSPGVRLAMMRDMQGVSS
jgi:hypothetical protein